MSWSDSHCLIWLPVTLIIIRAQVKWGFNSNQVSNSRSTSWVNKVTLLNSSLPWPISFADLTFKRITASFEIGQIKIALPGWQRATRANSMAFIPMPGNNRSSSHLIFHFYLVRRRSKLTTNHSISPLPLSFLSNPTTKFYTPILAK